MWPRLMELMIAGWLMASPFVFGHSQDDWSLWLNDFLCAAMIALCAGLSWWIPRLPFHFLELLVAVWLMGFGYLARAEPLPALQNHILVALVLMMFAIIPNNAHRPPVSWREMQRAESESDPF